MTLKARLAKLERRMAGDEISPLVRAWLGWPLTPAQARQAAEDARRPEPAVDWNLVSKEMREWLQR